MIYFISLGIGDWAQSTILNPQSPYLIYHFYFFKYNYNNLKDYDE